MRNRLFIGIYPTGIVYADRRIEVRGDYKKLAYLSFDLRTRTIEKDCPAQLETLIRADMEAVIAMRGEKFEVSECGQYVILGGPDDIAAWERRHGSISTT